MHIFIITGGRIDIDFASNYLKEQEPDCIIAADHGLDACRQMDIMPDYIFGDFDSVKTETYAFYTERVPDRIKRFPTRKDETDTELAIHEAIRILQETASSESIMEENEADTSFSNHKITILGATGTRLDHVVGNIHLLKVALDAGVDCQIVDDHNRIRLVNDALTLDREEQFGEFVSLLPFTDTVEGITLKGFEYDVEDWTMNSGLARGVSNEIKEEVAEISMRSGILILFETRD